MAYDEDDDRFSPDGVKPGATGSFGFSMDADLAKLFEEAEQTIDKIVSAKKETHEEPPESSPEPAPAKLSSRELQELQDRHDQLKRRFDELGEEFDNYRARTERQCQALALEAKAQLIKDLLEIIDLFELAKNTFQSEKFQQTVENYRKGLDLLYKHFHGALEAVGVQRIMAEGVGFDPEIHQAIAVEESEQYDSQVVLAEVKPGFIFNDILIRPAVVKVGVPPRK